MASTHSNFPNNSSSFITNPNDYYDIPTWIFKDPSPSSFSLLPSNETNTLQFATTPNWSFQEVMNTNICVTNETHRTSVADPFPRSMQINKGIPNGNALINIRVTKPFEGKRRDNYNKRRASKAQKKRVSKKSGRWSSEEDSLLYELINRFGVDGNWHSISVCMGNRSGKQCRERWNNHLHPNIKKTKWTEEEEEMLIQQHKIHGNKWVTIAKMIPGRPEASVKNYWNATKRKLRTKKKLGARVNNTALEKYILSKEKEEKDKADLNGNVNA